MNAPNRLSHAAALRHHREYIVLFTYHYFQQVRCGMIEHSLQTLAEILPLRNFLAFYSIPFGHHNKIRACNVYK